MGPAAPAAQLPPAPPAQQTGERQRNSELFQAPAPQGKAANAQRLVQRHTNLLTEAEPWQTTCCAAVLPGQGQAELYHICLQPQQGTGAQSITATLGPGCIPVLGGQRPSDSSPGGLQLWKQPLPDLLGWCRPKLQEG